MFFKVSAPCVVDVESRKEMGIKPIKTKNIILKNKYSVMDDRKCISCIHRRQIKSWWAIATPPPQEQFAFAHLAIMSMY